MKYFLDTLEGGTPLPQDLENGLTYFPPDTKADNDFHRFGIGVQWEYIRNLEQRGKLPPVWPVLADIQQDVLSNSVVSIRKYKNKKYHITSPESFRVEDAKRMRIGIIGAGAAGLCALRHASRVKSWEVVAWEHNSRPGGTWIYTEETDKDKFGFPIQSSMYANLR